MKIHILIKIHLKKRFRIIKNTHNTAYFKYKFIFYQNLKNFKKNKISRFLNFQTSGKLQIKFFPIKLRVNWDSRRKK